MREQSNELCKYYNNKNAKCNLILTSITEHYAMIICNIQNGYKTCHFYLQHQPE
jgi:hypothetical protein